MGGRAPGEREGKLGANSRLHGTRIPWVALGQKVPLFQVHLEDSTLLLQGQKIWLAPLSSSSTAEDRSMCRGQKKWLQLFTVLHYKHQEPAQPWDCFSGSEWCSNGEAFLCKRRMGPCLAKFFKIWSFESQSHTRDKAQESCGTLWVDGPGTQG